MATYNKPGVYIQETITPNVPSSFTAGPSMAAFIGVADRGPTTLDNNGNVIPVPQIISSFDEFNNTFGFSSVLGGFDSSLIYSTATSGVSVVGTSPSFNADGSPAADSVFALKYAVKSFFDNGGNQAVIVRDVNSDATTAYTEVNDQSGSLSIDATKTGIKVEAYTDSNGSYLKLSALSHYPFNGISAGTALTVTQTGVSNATTAPILGVLLPDNINSTSKTFVVSGVTASNSVMTLYCPELNNPLSTATAATGVITFAGAVSGYLDTNAGTTGTLPQPALGISANGAGAWGNNIWISISPNNTPNYFDLKVYYSNRTSALLASGSSGLKDSELVESFYNLNLDPTDTAHFVENVVSSKWIKIKALNTGSNNTKRLPQFTMVWSSSAVNNDGTFVWNAYNTTGGSFDSSNVNPDIAFKLGAQTVTSPLWSGTYQAGLEGHVLNSSARLLATLDAFQVPLVINSPAIAASSILADGSTSGVGRINASMKYAADRGDSFVVIDPGTATSVDNVLADMSAYNTNSNYGAVYYPNILVDDATSSVVGVTKIVPPGGAVAAVYCNVDANTGAFRSPAGGVYPLANATPSRSLSVDDFNKIGSAQKYINVIRYITGSGTCIMGARTIQSANQDIYISVRRSLNYLNYTLKNATQFAVFEPNDANLWSKVSAAATGVLDDFWRAGGLAGATAAEAYYVKCDSSINTPTSIAAGQLNVEVGVALQRPAEFVIIKLGQINGGTTVTTSI